MGKRRRAPVPVFGEKNGLLGWGGQSPELAVRPASLNHVKGFFAQLKRSIDGTHHHVAVDRLQR